MKNLLIAQSGGPTAVINASLAGVVEAACVSSRVDGILGAFYGIQGVLKEQFVDLKKVLKAPVIPLCCARHLLRFWAPAAILKTMEGR